jgi:short chain dehydrogenase
VHKDSNRRDNEANSSSRRKLLTATGLGAVSVAASSLLGQNPAASQTAAKPDRQAFQNQELKGKTAFITGGARGLGLATAEELAKAGANIVLYDIASGKLPNVQYPISTDRVTDFSADPDHDRGYSGND